jgi:hypothetical protein
MVELQDLFLQAKHLLQTDLATGKKYDADEFPSHHFLK